STGTHGTGLGFGGLAAQVHGLELVLADGSIVRCGPDTRPDLFAAARVGLGALGVITAVTLRCEPAYALHAVERPMPLDQVLGDLDRLVADNDHFEFYWFPHTARTLTKSNNRVPDGTDARPLSPLRAWLDDHFLSNSVFEYTNRLCTVLPSLTPLTNGIATRALAAREYIDRSYRVFCSPRRVVFRETEWALPRAALPDVLRELDRWIERTGARVSFPVEVRFAPADDIWLSTAHGRETAYVAVHQYHRVPYERYFRAVEAIALDAGGRPHWGKLHWCDAERLRKLYARFDDFRAVRDDVDPERVFANPYLGRVLGP
ncbi:MAG TPA: D-arabinono-1,4-lactone oxidase, partial [Actinopolymorphaceae bacterium]